MDLILPRFAYLPNATLGFLIADTLRLATLEEPWIANANGPGGVPKTPGHEGSCVPDGEYVLDPHNSVDHPHVWALINGALGIYHYAIPPGQSYGRTACLIHSGNTTHDTQGCILVGMRHTSDGKGGILSQVETSRDALARLQGLLGRNSHRLLIRAYTGTGAPLWT